MVVGLTVAWEVEVKVGCDIEGLVLTRVGTTVGTVVALGVRLRAGLVAVDPAAVLAA